MTAHRTTIHTAGKSGKLQGPAGFKGKNTSRMARMKAMKGRTQQKLNNPFKGVK